jgi:3-oxoacyl-[acyl-carrier protein] reductase
VDLGLQGKRAWVLGASAGLGKATAAALAAEGARVVVSSRNTDRLQAACAEIGALNAVPLDVAEGKQAIEGACEAASEQLGGLDIVVSNHGGPPTGTFDDIDDAKFAAAFELVLASAFRVTKAALPHLRSAGGGVIAYVTSSSTREVLPNLLLSNTMRTGVTAMVKTLSRELAPDGVRLFCAAPGRISTERADSVDTFNAERQGTTFEEVRAAMAREIPLGRYGEPREFGDLVAFLCSERASYVTGVTALIDGGRLWGVAS